MAVSTAGKPSFRYVTAWPGVKQFNSLPSLPLSCLSRLYTYAKRACINEYYFLKEYLQQQPSRISDQLFLEAGVSSGLPGGYIRYRAGGHVAGAEIW